MGVFRIERPQQWPGQAVEKADQWALRSESARTLSAMTAFFKVGLDRGVLRLSFLRPDNSLNPGIGDRDGKRTAHPQSDLDRPRPAGGPFQALALRARQ